MVCNDTRHFVVFFYCIFRCFVVITYCHIYFYYYKTILKMVIICNIFMMCLLSTNLIIASNYDHYCFLGLLDTSLPTGNQFSMSSQFKFQSRDFVELSGPACQPPGEQPQKNMATHKAKPAFLTRTLNFS